MYRVFLLVVVLLPLNAVRADEAPKAFRDFRAIEPAVLFTGISGQWDAKIRERGWILREGSVWKMWYTGYNPDEQPLCMKLGYATSIDGIHWERHPGNPLIDDFWVEDIMVVRHDDSYLMFAEGAQDQAQLLESQDGIAWKRVGPLDVRLMSGQPIPPGPFGTPTAVLKDGIWHLFYERRDAGIWLATSIDRKVWTNVSDDPVIVPGPAAFDRLMIAMNQIIPIDGKYVAVLHGTGTPEKPRQWSTYLAVSQDLKTWTKAEGTLRPVSENKSSGLLISDEQNRWRLYTMHEKVSLHLSP
jgi:hypothetical protein